MLVGVVNRPTVKNNNVVKPKNKQN